MIAVQIRARPAVTGGYCDKPCTGAQQGLSSTVWMLLLTLVSQWDEVFLGVRSEAALLGCHMASGTEDVSVSQIKKRGWPRGVTASTLDPESSDRGSNPREACCDWWVPR